MSFLKSPRFAVGTPVGTSFREDNKAEFARPASRASAKEGSSARPMEADAKRHHAVMPIFFRVSVQDLIIVDAAPCLLPAPTHFYRRIFVGESDSHPQSNLHLDPSAKRSITSKLHS